MGDFDYEVKEGKYIAFKNKEQQRFTRAKTIGANYTEDSIKNRIQNKDKEVGNIIDIKSSKKVKSSKSYENWATMHNLKTTSETMVLIHEKGYASIHELEKDLSKLSLNSNDLRKEFKARELEQKRIKEIVKDLQICVNKQAHYDGYKKNPNDKIYKMINKKDIESYEKAYAEIEVFIKQFPHLKNIVVNGLKQNDNKFLFKSLNNRSKILQSEMYTIAMKHDEMKAKFEKLNNLKLNIDQFIGEFGEPKKSIVKEIEKDRIQRSKNVVIKQEKVNAKLKNSNIELR